MTSEEAKNAWQSSVEIAGTPEINEVRAKADKFYRTIRRRNAIEYIACAVSIVCFTYYLFTLDNIFHKIGSALVVAASIYAPWQLHRRASAVAPETAGTVPIYVFMRSQLVRQRDALRGLFSWYILPFLPGVALFIAGNGLDPKIEAAGPPIWARWLFLAILAAVFFVIWWLNQLGARKLQKKIDEIDAVTGEGA